MGFKDKLLHRFHVDASTQRFIDHNRKKWRKKSAKNTDSVILVDLFDWNPSIYCFSYITNYLAEKTGSMIRAFKFERSFSEKLGLPSRRLEKIYESFGAKLDLTYSTGRKHQAAAKAFAEKTIASLKTKRDVLNISIDGIEIGGLIYDSYLRVGHYTADLKDPVLKEFIESAFVVYQTCKEYFDSKTVKAVLTTHYVYVTHGILVKVAFARKVPVFFVNSPEQFVLTEVEPHTCNNLKYDKYADMFNALPESEKEPARAEARKILEERLLGGVDRGIADNILEEGRTGLIGYGPISEKPLMKDTGRPRILVMLNDFFDAPHWYRWMLHDDFWEWINALLTKAVDTPFDWYVKPHPAGLKYNDALFEMIKERHPKINFLERKSSNRQLVKEGLTAMFTVYGTAGHEFAYMGIPVVNAGDNPHIAFDFNLHPKTVAEYEHCVLNADKLKVNLDKTKVEEFFYIHYLYQFKKNDFDARCIDAEFDWFKLGSKVNQSSVFDSYIKTETALKDQKLKAYFDQYFSKYFPSQIQFRREDHRQLEAAP